MMDDVNEKAFADLSCHILIRDKNSKTVLLNKHVNRTRSEKEIIQDVREKWLIKD
jgi:hypothetical protein